jgi:hypothetical protein
MTMKKVQFIFGIHNHQPVGNFDDVFHHACDHSYLPFLQVLEKFPTLSMAFHFSGSLIEWLEGHRPDVLDLFRKLVQRGNVEVLGAGFYEPILAMIPEHDQIGQIRKMSQWAQDSMGYGVKGNWLTERVWEPHLARNLAKAGIEYMVVDDYHFLSSGADPDNLNGFFQTEHEGHTLGVFPISQQLRYAMPFEDPQVTIDHLRAQLDKPGSQVVVMADDGEKFGIWPGTYQTVYEEKWLERFFTLLVENEDWLETSTFKSYYQNNAPQGLVYLPTSSYFEMSQWTLRTNLGIQMDQFVHQLQDEGRWDQNRAFIKGGMWRNFLSKYPESNWMQKRVQFHSLEIQRLQETQTVPQDLIDDLYRAQCNCAYWHGVFGGLYLPHLRHAIYEHLLKAEKQYLKAGGSFSGLADIDADGHREYRLRSDKIQLFISSHSGQICEIDWLPADFNLSNYLQRYTEHYHGKLAQASAEHAGGGSIHDLVLTKEAGLQDKLFEDKYPRRSLVDHVFAQDQSLDDYYRGNLEELIDMEACQVQQSEAGVTIQSTASVKGQALSIEKKLTLHHKELSMDITLSNLSKTPLSMIYGLEFNFGLLGGNSPDRYYLIDGENRGPLNSMGEHKQVSKAVLVNEWDNFIVQLQFYQACELWRAPIETVSMSEAGFERVYQASSLLPHWQVSLAAGETINIKLGLCADLFKEQ